MFYKDQLQDSPFFVVVGRGGLLELFIAYANGSESLKPQKIVVLMG